MQNSLVALTVISGIGTLVLMYPAVIASEQKIPLTPNTAVVTDGAGALPQIIEPIEPPPAVYPTKVSIPSIKLTSSVVGMGLTHTGALDVPDGKTKNVGWYKDGTIPGNIGSAVLDAHVFAAFANLRYAKVGSDIYVTMSDGAKLHFKITDSRVYKLSEIPLDLLFNKNDAKHLNLITCAGKLTADRSTYTHRLIVYATLVD